MSPGSRSCPLIAEIVHILKDGGHFCGLCRQSISLVSKAFNLIPEAFFRKTVEVSVFIFIFGLGMLSITNLFTVTISSKRKLSVLQLIPDSIGRLFRPVLNALKLSESNRNSRNPIRILLFVFSQSSCSPK